MQNVVHCDGSCYLKTCPIVIFDIHVQQKLCKLWLQKKTWPCFIPTANTRPVKRPFFFFTCQPTCVQSIANPCAACKVESHSNVSYRVPPSLLVSAYDLQTNGHTTCRIALPSFHCCHSGSEMGGYTTRDLAVLMMISRRSNHCRVKYQVHSRCHRCQLHYHSQMV